MYGQQPILTAQMRKKYRQRSGLIRIFTSKWAQQILSRYAKTENHNACRKNVTEGALQPTHQCSQFFLGKTHASIALKL
jgi:hypothetical protein